MRRLAIVLAVLLTAPGLSAQTDYLKSLPGAIGLLALPEVHGPGECSRFIPTPVTLWDKPRGKVVGSVFVRERPPSGAEDGCLEVGVRMRPTVIDPFPTMEHGYEAPAAIVLEQRDRWFRVRLHAGSAWLEGSARDEFFGLEALYRDSLTYMTDAWNGHLATSAGAKGRAFEHPNGTIEVPVNVTQSVRHKGVLWFFVQVMNSSCEGEEPRVIDQGWVPAYGKSKQPSIWFHSRGC